MTLDQVTRADFAACLGQPFAIHLEDGVLTAELTSVTTLGAQQPSRPGVRESFSLIFHVPRSCRFLQGLCHMSHPAMGSMEIFLVAIGPDAKGLRLEAIFNFI